MRVIPDYDWWVIPDRKRSGISSWWSVSHSLAAGWLDLCEVIIITLHPAPSHLHPRCSSNKLQVVVVCNRYKHSVNTQLLTCL